MTSNLLLSSSLHERITEFNWINAVIEGFLVSPDHDWTTIQGVWQQQIEDINELHDHIDACLSVYPCGKAVVGFVKLIELPLSSPETYDQAILEQELVNTFGSLTKVNEAFGRDSLLVMCLYRAGGPAGDDIQMEFVNVHNGELKPMSTVTKPTQEMNSGAGLVKLRLRAEIPTHLSTLETKGGNWSMTLNKELRQMQKLACGGSFALGFDTNQALLFKGGMALGSGSKNWKQVKDIKKYLKDAAEKRGEEVQKAKQSNKGFQKPIDVSLFKCPSGSDDVSSQSHAPIFVHDKGSFLSVDTKLPIDILAEVREDLSVHKLYTMMMESVSRQIAATVRIMQQYSTLKEMITPKVYHFKPLGLDTSVSLVYSMDHDEYKEMAEYRAELHNNLLIRKDRPCLRPVAAGLFLCATAPGGYLINPHAGLTVPQAVRSGKVAYVKGYYSYHHYMQDRFDDDKWGCAYRSLQTICSWFKYQGYTNKNVLTHRQIQESLHRCGDKNSKFVGSKQWIGSFEVSYVLQHELKAQSKFITASHGSELSTVGQQLLSHFETEGTPIMIGGGVLAHTIIGVAYDDLSGEIAFLILDPHYTGGEDLKYILDKGWCGWKGMSFWSPTAHYNLCCPQTPKFI